MNFRNRISKRSAAHRSPLANLTTRRPYVLITGGAGFIGTNLAARYASLGMPVIIYDNLHRTGAEQNLDWLRARYPRHIGFVRASVLDSAAIRDSVQRATHVFHLAAQVAAQTSLESPTDDFETNARGTLNVLEACRELVSPPPILFTSTSQVYGDMTDVALALQGNRYQPIDSDIRTSGYDERRALDFHTPYGCSKGVADQYMLDFARCYGLSTVVFRMSSIYGPHQHGSEDQGWVAHFARALLAGDPLTIYGNGHQVSDLLYVEDLVDAMLAAMRGIDGVRGRAFNIGGGPRYAHSVLQVIERLAELSGSQPQLSFEDWRAGDQRYYVSDTSAFRRHTGWQAAIPPREGIERLIRWLTWHASTPAPTDYTPMIATAIEAM